MYCSRIWRDWTFIFFSPKCSKHHVTKPVDEIIDAGVVVCITVVEIGLAVVESTEVGAVVTGFAVCITVVAVKFSIVVIAVVGITVVVVVDVLTATVLETVVGAIVWERGVLLVCDVVVTDDDTDDAIVVMMVEV